MDLEFGGLFDSRTTTKFTSIFYECFAFIARRILANIIDIIQGGGSHRRNDI